MTIKEDWLRRLSPCSFEAVFPVKIIGPEGDELVIWDCTLDTIDERVAEGIKELKRMVQ